MNLYLKNQIIQIPDSDVLYYTAEGIVVTRTSKLKNNKFDKIIPHNLNSFKEVMVRGISYFYNLKKEDIKKEDIKKMEYEFKSNKIKIRVGDKWFEYPDNQIKSWDSEGNIEWSDKIHWKFLRGRPTKGDEFIPSDETQFIKHEGCFYNKNSNSNIIFKLPSQYYKDRKIALIGSGNYSHDLIDFSIYDIVVGVNQIYKTNILDKIDIIYHGLSVKDPEFIELLPDISNYKKVIFIPRIVKSNNTRISELLYEFKYKNYKFYWEPDIRRDSEDRMQTNPLSGIVALEHIIEQEPLYLDLYGFNFYTDSYIEGMSILDNHPSVINNIHDLNKNKSYFIEILNKNKKINWIE
jgi:hypothetical protein